MRGSRECRPTYPPGLQHGTHAPAGTGVNVYTHGEMLPAHMYPELKKHAHLVGHFGGAWQKQKKEFARFTGPILATTNCVLIPKEEYADRLFTTRATAVPGGKRLMANDFSALIEAAKKAAPLTDGFEKFSTVGFHHTAILGLAGQIVDAVKSGKNGHFYLIGGCDGAEPGRNYFSEFAAQAPADSVILTLGCGKFRIRDHEYGTIDLGDGVEVPRLLDLGQCNDAFGAIQVAAALAEAFECTVNDLPLTIVLSWFEQKAVAVLLTLLSRGVKGIRIGPAAPAFVSPAVFSVLQDSFDLRLTGDDPVVDLEADLARS